MAIRITDTTPRAELEQTIREVLRSVRRMGDTVPAFYARGHERINALLDDWEQADA